MNVFAPGLSIALPQYAIEALDMVRGVLPMVSQMNKLTSPTSLDAPLSSGVHVADVETDHPYPQATVLHYQVGYLGGYTDVVWDSQQLFMCMLWLFWGLDG